MIKKFLTERRSWIIFFLSQQLLITFIAYIDSTIPIKPVLYIVFLTMLMFIIFLVIRYNKETRFYRSLEEWETNLDLTSIADPQRPFEEIIESSVINQTEKLKAEASRHFTALEQEKDELLAWIHEVKTPLTAMHLILDRIDDHAVKAQLTYEWLRVHLLLDQQLHQKRIPFMENDLYIEHTNLQEVIYQEIKTLQSWCIQKRIGFDIQLEAIDVLTDAKWLAFIIRQLLSNAVKYSKEADIIITSSEQNGRITLKITDHGRGIDSKDLPRIFEKGFTSTTDHQNHAATGMGLYLANKVAHSLLIHIDVDSKPGAGATFTLTFPRRNEFSAVTGV